MKNYIISILILAFSLLSTFCFSQSRTDLEKKRAKTMEDIKYTNQLINQTKESQKQSYSNLLLINNKINTRKQLIEHIKQEILLVENKIEETNKIVNFLEEDLLKLKEEYAQMLRIAWKNHNTFNNILFLFSSESFNQSFLRFKHMQQLAEYRKKQFKAIDYVQYVLKINIKKLEEVKKIKQDLLAEEQIEARTLQREQVQQQQAINKLKNQEDGLKKKLREQQRQAEQLQKEIQKLIAEEAKRTSGSTTGTYALTPAEQIISTNFGNNRGKLPWPVERGVIVSNYGKQPHPVLRGIEIENKGIDIATTAGTNARAIFDGEVRRVISLPGAHNAVIIRHGEYLSVYTNLETVNVKTGDQIKINQHIGKVYTDKNENKTIIHLEIWKGSTTLNPSLWLSK